MIVTSFVPVFTANARVELTTDQPIVAVGSDVILHCSVLNTSSSVVYHFSWSHNGSTIRNFMNSTSSDVYTIERINISAVGVYSCSVNETSTATINITLGGK